MSLRPEDDQGRMSRVTVIIPNYNGLKFMGPCMSALSAQTYTDFCVLIVDNGSTDGSVEWINAVTSGEPSVSRRPQKEAYAFGISSDKEIKAVEAPDQETACGLPEKPLPFEVSSILLRDNTGFAGAVNIGIGYARSELVLLLNNDTEPRPDFIKSLVEAFDRGTGDGAKAGATVGRHPGAFNRGPKDSTKAGGLFAASPRMIQLYHKELLDDAGDGYNLLGWAFQRGVGQPVSASKFAKGRSVFSACAGASMYRRDILEEIALDGTVSYEGIGGPAEAYIHDEASSLSGTGNKSASPFQDGTGPAAPLYTAREYFDTEHFAYLEDLDLSFRARIHGYDIRYVPEAEVYHVGSGTSGSKYNPFKVRLAARNNIWFVWKNMPLLMLLINLPGLLLGMAIKQLFFIRKGFGGDYARGLLEGIRGISRCRKVHFKPGRLGNYAIIELGMLRDTFSYIGDFLRRRLGS